MEHLYAGGTDSGYLLRFGLRPHGKCADLLANRLAQQGVQNIALYDVSHTDVSLLVSEAFRCSHLVFAASTYNNGIFTPMENLLLDLKAHNLQKRTVALIENGSWGTAVRKADGRNCFLHEKHDAAGRDRQRQILCEGGAVRGVESSSRRAGRLISWPDVPIVARFWQS